MNPDTLRTLVPEDSPLAQEFPGVRPNLLAAADAWEADRQRLEAAGKALRCADAILGGFMEPDSGGQSAMIIDYRLVADVRQQIAALAADGFVRKVQCSECG